MNPRITCIVWAFLAAVACSDDGGPSAATGTGGTSSGTGGTSSGTGGASSGGTSATGGAATGGGNATGGGGSVTSGVTPTKKINELTNAEAQALCEAFVPQFDRITAGACVYAALALAPDKATCESTVAGCASTNSSASIDCAGTDVSQAKDCALAVGDFEACLNETASFFGGLTCDAAGQGTPAPPDCFSQFTNDCPSLFAGGADAGP